MVRHYRDLDFYMSFEPAGNFLRSATDKYNLTRQAQSGLVCARVRDLFASQYTDFAALWEPQKFEDGVLFVQTQDSAASSELFLRTHEIMERVGELDLEQSVNELRIVK